MNPLIVKSKALYSGHYKLEVFRLDGSIKQTIEFDNLITDLGLDHIASPPVSNTSFSWPYLNTHCEVGTGNATPSFSDTGCQTPLAMFPTAAGSNIEGGTKTYVAPVGGIGYWKCVWLYQFGTGAAAGNLTEIVTGGTLFGDTHVRAFSRALILDGSGNPTTLTVLSDEVLRVTYELRMYFSTADQPYSFVISGITYSGTKRRADLNTGSIPQFDLAIQNFNSTTIAMSPRTAAIVGTNTHPAGSGTTVFPTSRGPYTAGNHYVDFTFDFALTDSNQTSLSIYTNSNHGWWQYSLSPSLVKDNTQTMQIIQRYSWDRYVP